MLDNDFINNELPGILNIFLLNGFLNKGETNRREYDLLTDNFKDINQFVYDNFGINFYKSKDNRSIRLNKLSSTTYTGFGKDVSVDTFRLLFLVLSSLAKVNVGDSILWSKLVDESSALYRICFNKDISVSKANSSYKEINRFLTRNDINILEEIDASEDERLYKLLKEVTSESIRKISINHDDNYFKQAKSFLLLNGCVSKDNNKELFNALKNNTQSCLYHTQNFFDKLKGDDGVGYYLMEFEDSYMLVYRGYNIFPKLMRNFDVLFIEVLSNLDLSRRYTYEDLETLVKGTVAYKQRIGIKNDLKNALKELINNLTYYGFMTIEFDNLDEINVYIPTGSCSSIKSDYNEDGQMEFDLLPYNENENL